MTAEMDNIIIEHLKALRNELKEFRSETREDLQTIKNKPLDFALMMVAATVVAFLMIMPFLMDTK